MQAAVTPRHSRRLRRWAPDPQQSSSSTLQTCRSGFSSRRRKTRQGFAQRLRAAFGDKASLAQIDQLLDLALAGKLPMPSNIQFVEAGSLGSGALGAYDAGNGGSLYLDRSLLSDPAKLQSVFNEEMGHHLDVLLGGADAAGDEGAVFSRTLESGPLSQTELTALKSEDDHGVIQIGGRWVQVEFHEEGGDDSGDEGSGGDNGGGGTESGGTESGGTESGTESGGGTESSVGECSAHDSGDTNEPEDRAPSHTNGNSDTDKAGSGKGNNSNDDKTDTDDTSDVGDDGTNTSDDTETRTESEPDSTSDDDTESAAEPEPEERGFWSRALDTVQMGLDVAGFVPGLGVGADLLNAGIHLARGNKGEAAISAAAAIPLGGDAFKAGVMGVRAADRLNDGRRAVDSAEDIASSRNIVRNAHLAGKNHPVTGIPFDKNGFPDFSSVKTADVNIKPTGKRRSDDKAANAEAGLEKTPENYTWHHHQDNGRMQLVPRDIHTKTGHTGGFSINKPRN